MCRGANFMTSPQTLAADVVCAIFEFSTLPALSDKAYAITYGRLGQFAWTLRKGAGLWFPDASALFALGKLADFLVANHIDEMLFTSSVYDTFLTALEGGKAAALPLTRVVLNGEVVRDK